MSGQKPSSTGSGSGDISHALTFLEPDSTSRDVLDALSRMIELAGLGIGDRLPPEVEIAKKLGVGRAKVREALIAWQNMGIVTRNKKAGTRLAAEVVHGAIHLPVTLKLEAESLLRSHSVRRPIEVEAVRHATRNATKQQRMVILARAAELLAVYATGEDWREADSRFHSAIHLASGNPLFGQLVTQIKKAFDDIYDAPFGQPHLGAASIPRHRDLADAIASGDEDRAVEAIEQIMDLVEFEVRNIMENQNV